jgi:hypothetical protein
MEGAANSEFMEISKKKNAVFSFNLISGLLLRVEYKID